MTFCELIDAVHRDCAARYPTAFVSVECDAHRYGHSDPPSTEVRFRIYHDETVLDGLNGVIYDGATPDEAYDKFLAAVMQPATPGLPEVLRLCDTPTVAVSHPDVTCNEEWSDATAF